MKTLFLSLIALTVLATTTLSQGVNQITISPSNPTANDTITVISNFSYYGNCSFGLVHYYTYFVNPLIQIIPTYCGYGDTNLCNSIDTFKTGPFPGGNYTISIEYHQGSICPLSGFDATIAQFDTSIIVSTASGTPDFSITHNSFLSIYPNPSSNSIHIKKNFISEIKPGFKIINVLGETVARMNSIPNEINIEALATGAYCILFEYNGNRQVITFLKN
ncbi:MAG TPA: T9SS type A sorting domain-containing protein [Bacteroidia bacterium]|nr:T9SS type A sorting domain-containing protein [Bacteroidia bacterium]